MKNLFQLLLTGMMLMIMANCGGGGGTVSTLATTDSFSDGDLFNPKMDILWVVDPSKSMFEEVEKVRNNIATFIQGFIALGYEYRMGVISTAAWSDEAYQADPTNLPFLFNGGEPIFAKLHKGECVDLSGSAAQPEYLDYLNSSSVGSFLSKFNNNFDVYGVQINTSGCGLVGPPFGSYASVANNFFEDPGYDVNSRQRVWEYVNDERPLQSIKAFLERDAAKPAINRFVRDDAHLAIIIVSDEPDASRDSLTPSLTFQVGQAGNHTAQQYIDYLNTFKGNISNYSIYSIVDSSHPVNISEDIATASGGLFFDINASQSEYVTNLNQISNAILASSSFFPIAYKPIVSTIEIQIVKANGTIIDVPKDTGSGGWTYVSANQGVTISVNYLPAKGDSLNIDYIPAVLIDGVSDQPRLILSNSSVLENAVNGTAVGTVSLKNGDAAGGVYSITADTSSGGFAIDSVTGEITVADTNLLDTEVQGRQQLDVLLTLPSTATYTKSFLISITDEPDSLPVAVADSYEVSETIADQSGNIQIFGNLTYNDTGIDASEAHTYAVVSGLSPANGVLTFNANGTFEYNVDAASLGLTAGNSAVMTFTYHITDAATNVSNTANVTITINGYNEPPVLYNPIADQTVSFSGGMVKIPIVDTDVTSSGYATGSSANLVDNSNGTSATTSSGGGAHYIQLNFPGSTIYEVDHFDINGAHSLGNAIFQVLAPSTSQVITREALPVTLGSVLTVNMAQKVIGGGVKILRPIGAKNSNNDQNLQINEISVYGIEAQSFTIDLTNHFSDADIGDTMTFYVTDQYGEGPAPGWLSIQGNNLVGIPPAGANTDVGIIAQDTSGATAFTVFNITRTGSGSGASNAPPIAVLPLNDEKRGGISHKRFGGGSSSNDPQVNNQIVWGEIDNFFVNPYDGQAIRDAFTNSGLCTGGTGTCNLSASGYRTNPSSIPSQISALLPPAQIIHFGDNYSTENGWDSNPVYSDDKYPVSSSAYCSQSAFLTAGNGGRVTPCINATRSYGETYTGYFVPAKTGIYRFRTRQIDDNIRLFLAPSEYVEDLTPVVTVSYCVSSMVTMTQSVAPGLNTGSTCSSEFRGYPGGPTGGNNGAAVGSPTQIFYEGTTASYKDGYTLLKQGNAYAFELRFGEGGGAVAFEFEYDRKDQSCDPTTNSPTSGCWDGFRPIDASVLVPSEGSDAHTPQAIPALAGVNLDVKTLFYDAEQDVLDYTAKLINPDGTDFVGPGSTSDVTEIGLSLNAQNGLLVGTLNSTYTNANPKPRVVFTVTERFTSAQASTSSLPIKFDPTL